MRKFVLVFVALLLYAGGCSTDETPPQPIPTQPPTGSGISSQSPQVGVETQLWNLRFVPPDQNNTGKWWRPVDGATAAIGTEEDQVTVVFPMEGGPVTCIITPTEVFGAEMTRLDQHKNRADLLEEPSCE